jgi:hypothetical protein
LAWYSVIAIAPSLARSSFLKLASARARASSILVVNVISYSADGRRCIRRPSSGSPPPFMLILLNFKAHVIGSMALFAPIATVAPAVFSIVEVEPRRTLHDLLPTT